MNPIERSRADWLEIHNSAARDYHRGEWTREVVLGLGKQRRQLFGQARGNVLDVACGYGINFPYLLRASHITGVDFSPVMLDMARRFLRKSKAMADIRKGDAEALQFPDNTFDTVVSSLSTCSFLNPLNALREMQRVCKLDGRILLLEHGRSSWGWLGRYQDRHAPEMIKQGGCRWNQEPMTLLQEAGLQILHVERTGLGILYMITAAPPSHGSA